MRRYGRRTPERRKETALRSFTVERRVEAELGVIPDRLCHNEAWEGGAEGELVRQGVVRGLVLRSGDMFRVTRAGM